jgi:regulator of sirC expression with transglutaminase-like and TPR domain
MGAFENLADGKSISLIEAALECARDEYPDLDIASYLEQVQHMAEGFDLYMTPGSQGAAILVELNEFFFHELGFRGNTCDYYDARNSYLNDVIDRRVGIPISLSVLYQHLAASAGIKLEGINFPGHFLLAWTYANGQRVYVDVYNQGLLLSWEDCQKRMEEHLGFDQQFSESEFSAMADREILIRMLRNLKGIYSRHDCAKCLRIQERISRLLPEDPRECRDLGILYFQAGRPMHAVRTLEKVLRDHPDWPERASVETYLARAMREAVLLN